MWHCNCEHYTDAVDAPTEAGTVWVSRWTGTAFRQWARPLGEIGVPEDVMEAAEEVTPVCSNCNSICWQGPRPSVDEADVLDAYKVKFIRHGNTHSGRVLDVLDPDELGEHYEEPYLSVKYREYATADYETTLITPRRVVSATAP